MNSYDEVLQHYLIVAVRLLLIQEFDLVPPVNVYLSRSCDQRFFPPLYFF